jgi:tRNA pseudouridine38-40 synthase
VKSGETGQSQDADGSPKLYKYIAEVAYDGTQYAGFQLQLSPQSFSSHLENDWSENKGRKSTIQGKLERALTKFLALSRSELKLQGAGRTDAGVHARGQVVHFFSKRELDGYKRAVKAVNSLLPEDIRVNAIRRVPLDFNVRYSLGKVYTYDLDVSDVYDPCAIRYRRHIADPERRFSIRALAIAVKAFTGMHDFAQFASRRRDGSTPYPPEIIEESLAPFDEEPSGTRTVFSRRGTVRTIRSARVQSITRDWLRISFEGDGFLYKQVRHMVGAALAVGWRRLTVEDIKAALVINNYDTYPPYTQRTLPNGAYEVAKASGLCLHQVFLPEIPELSLDKKYYDSPGQRVTWQSEEDELELDGAGHTGEKKIWQILEEEQIAPDSDEE